MIRGELLTGQQEWQVVHFLLDTGADRTLLHAETLQLLQLEHSPAAVHLGGVSGVAAPVLVETTLRLKREDGTKIVFPGKFLAATEPSPLDMSLLGRDIISLFALIVDQPGNVVSLVNQRHGYSIVEY
ncbi:MAG: retroviral-like aspartic protease family protein [Gemmataceae bacterium]|nr:retroviral-like aspartic protease family protein [Gemmataceae bacterium]